MILKSCNETESNLDVQTFLDHTMALFLEPKLFLRHKFKREVVTDPPIMKSRGQGQEILTL